MKSANTITANPTIKEKLDAARERVKTAIKAVSVNEGRLLDFETADSINRTLSNALRDLETATINVAIMPRGQTATR